MFRFLTDLFCSKTPNPRSARCRPALEGLESSLLLDGSATLSNGVLSVALLEGPERAQGGVLLVSGAATRPAASGPAGPGT